MDEESIQDKGFRPPIRAADSTSADKTHMSLEGYIISRMGQSGAIIGACR